eukprot:s39_g33.t2
MSHDISIHPDKAVNLADILKGSADAAAMDAPTALPRLPRTNRATTALGRFQAETDAESFDVNLRLSCDGPRKCLQLVFSREKKTLGYIPTEVRPGSFLLRGIWVNLDLRCRGLASIFLALWIQMCEQLEVSMATERIHKPVLAIVLQKFGLVGFGSSARFRYESHLTFFWGSVRLWKALNHGSLVT